MKKYAMLAAPAALAAVLCGCTLFTTNVRPVPGEQTEYSYVTAPTAPVTGAPTETLTNAAPYAPTTEEPSAEAAQPSTVYVIPTLPPEATTAIRPTEHTTLAPMHTETAAPTESAAPETVPSAMPTGEVDLSIELPEANGKMEVSTKASNRFIAAVHAERGISVSLLAAVYSVPESGQNYVLEFTSETDRSAQALRRVYLLNKDGAVTSVAAADANERENVSVTENWFCMNVLIKGMILPAVQDELAE